MIILITLIAIFITGSHGQIASTALLNEEIPNLPICIVGAGLSGLNLASLLLEKGHNVHIFEKTLAIGGKVVTLRAPSDPEELQVELAPLVYTAKEAKYLIEKLNKFGLTSEPFDMTDHVKFDPETGEISKPHAPRSNEEKLALSKAFGTYVQHRNSYADQLSFGYLNASADLFDSFSDWLDKRGLQAMKPLFTVMVPAEGLGTLEETPALAILKFIDEPTLMGYAGKPGNLLRVKEGLDTLVNKMAETLPRNTIFIGREVNGIQRQRDPQILTFVQGEPAICKKVILAHPPLLSNIDRMVKLEPKERRVLDAVRIQRYVSAASHIPSMDHGVYSSSNLMGKGEVTAFLKQSTLKAQNMFSSYSWIRGDFKSPSTPADIQNVIRKLWATIKKMDPNGYLYYVQPYEYFPHVRTPALKAGFYKDLDKIQGNRGLYYATTLLGFENMNGALEMTNEFVKRYF